ncbi:MAG: hypothetical protein CL566_08045 [Alphaproteobacteria bacterium]|nr:hypothetical protein [Alphaproteobacteria bacterium]
MIRTPAKPIKVAAQRAASTRSRNMKMAITVVNRGAVKLREVTNAIGIRASPANRDVVDSTVTALARKCMPWRRVRRSSPRLRNSHGRMRGTAQRKRSAEVSSAPTSSATERTRAWLAARQAAPQTMAMIATVVRGRPRIRWGRGESVMVRPETVPAGPRLLRVARYTRPSSR